jgi:(S)-3,5-dihydroxyphenylglycine transaminase
MHCDPPRGGFFLWLHLDAGLDAPRVFEAAKQFGVAVTPGRGYYANGGGDREIRLVFSALPPAQLREAIGLLGRACAQVVSAARA